MKAQLEPLSHLEQSALNLRSIRLDRFDHSLHYHPEIEITYIRRSNGTCLIGDHLGAFESGELYLLGSGLPHVFRNTRLPPSGAAAEVLHGRADVIGGLLETTRELASIRRLIESAERGLCFTGAPAKRAGDLLRKMGRSSGGLRWELFFQLVRHLAEELTPAPLAAPNWQSPLAESPPDPLQKACNYILGHFADDIEHGTVAAHCGLSPSALSRLFRRATGRTYTDFVTMVRLGHACRLLLETESQVVEVAFASGFGNLANFNRRFRRAYGCNPRQYRQQSRSGRGRR